MDDNCLYHYCSLNTFVSIIQNRTIKLSEITKSNDSEEIKFLWDHYVSYIKSQCKNQLATHMLQYEIDNQMSKTDFLVACFSEKFDSLHMWNCYANGGICIGFDKGKLKEWAKHIHIFNNGVAYDEDCVYDQAKLDKVNYYDKNAIDDYIKKQFNGIQYMTNLFSEVFNKAPFTKMNFWSEEAEWRVSIPLIYSDVNEQFLFSQIPEDLDVKIPQKVEMSVKANNGFPLCVNCFVPFSPDMVESITLAPNCKADEIDLKKILLIYGFDFLIDKIQRSNGSLR